MPIYEYYCSICHGRFQHLAKRIGELAPPCPRCGNASVERMVSAVNVTHNNRYHERQLRSGADQVAEDDQRTIAGFLKDSGRLEGVEGVYGSKAYQELIYRRAAGATDADVSDLVDDLTSEIQASESTKMAGSLMFSDQVENRMAAEGPPEDHADDEQQSNSSTDAGKKSAQRSGKDLGWA